jgi:hypothetical protein
MNAFNRRIFHGAADGLSLGGSPLGAPSQHTWTPISHPEAEAKPAWPFPQPAGQRPDIVLCQARRKTKKGLVYCLASNPNTCGYVTRIDGGLICCHPKRNKITARTEAQRDN